jgi:methylthioribose-1-phosphate isomerase
MKISGRQYQTIWLAEDGWSVEIIDQTRLPHALETRRLSTLEDAARAIRTMQVRGAPLIGVTAAYGLCLALRDDASNEGLHRAVEHLASQRPTAVNLRWALEEVQLAVRNLPRGSRVAAAYARAARMAREDVETNRAIGEHGLGLLEGLLARKKPGARLNVLTHCNAGWLATVDWGTATAPIYRAHDMGLPIHVWVDETRPRNQGSALTAFELDAHGVSHTIIADNAGGHLMQRGEVDIVIVGADRVAANGDAANKIGTYLKALAARDTCVPFYVAMPHSTIDWSLENGASIPIEERSADEVLHMTGRTAAGDIATVQIAPDGSPAANPAFDITPSRLITGLITERGVATASGSGLLSLYPERQAAGPA